MANPGTYPTPALSEDDFYSTTLAQTITATDTTIYLNSLPTTSEGYLVLEPDSTTAREIIYFTSKGANYVTVPSTSYRGLGGTSAQAHSSGATVQQNNVSFLWKGLQSGEALTGLHSYFDESFQDYVLSGGTVTQATGLIASVSSGLVYINGRRLTFNAFSKTLTASKDTYIDITAGTGNNIATVSYTEINSGVTGSAPASNGIHIAKVNTNASLIGTITQVGDDTLGNFLKNPDPRTARKSIRKDISALSYSQQVTVTGWNYKQGTSAAEMTQADTFGVTFTSPPVVVISPTGARSTGSGAPTAISDLTLTQGGGSDSISAGVYGVTTTGFTVELMNGRGTFNNAAYFGYAWSATGTVIG